MATPLVITIGTDCSGMEAPIQALRNLLVLFRQKFSCEFNSHARKTIEANFDHDEMFPDLTERNNKTAPYVTWRNRRSEGSPSPQLPTLGVPDLPAIVVPLLVG
jgi:site-specific DNA-cytosine methylase